MFTSLLGAYISLTEKGGELARQRYLSLRKMPGFVIPYGNIRDAYQGVEISREEARSRLGIAPLARVVALFGFISRYKGVTELVERFSALQDNRAVLLVVGRAFISEVKQYLANQPWLQPSF